jgi:glycosyltransferase involved in cell wall biosynthesis
MHMVVSALAKSTTGATENRQSRVIVHAVEPAGGMAWYVSELAVALANCGTAVLLFCPANFEFAAKVRQAGVEVEYSPAREISYAGLAQRILRNLKFSARTTLALFRFMRHGDMVHFASMLHSPFSLALFLPVRLRRGVSIVTAHDPLPHQWFLPRSLRWLERQLCQLPFRLADGIIVHNATGKDLLVQQVGGKPDAIFVLPHGAYPEAAEFETTYPRFDCLRLLAFGSIRRDKGLHLAIQGVQMWPADVRVSLRLTIAGALHDGSEKHYWQTCKQLIATKPNGIEVIERHIEDQEIGPLMARHHAVLLPYTEFFSESGVANLALSHRRPIIASAFGGLGELIERGNCGIPIEHPTVESLTQALMAAICLGPARLEAMGHAGKQLIRETRSWDLVARQTAEAYSKLAGGVATQASHKELSSQGLLARGHR